MSKRTALADTPIGKVRVALLYKRGDWTVTEPVFTKRCLGKNRVTHLPTGRCAWTLTDDGFFSPEVAKRIVGRYAKELPLSKTFKGMMKHGRMATRIIREEVDRKANV